MADIGEHIKFPVRWDHGELVDKVGYLIGVKIDTGHYAPDGFDDIIGEYICAALNEKHQRDMAGTICVNCGLPGEAPWTPCKDGFDHDWVVVEKGESK